MSRRRTLNIAVYGGLASKVARFLEGSGLRIYGGASADGNGELNRLVSALRHGRIAEVWVLWRWIGHSELGAIVAACKAAGASCRLVSSISGVRRRLRKE